MIDLRFSDGGSAPLALHCSILFPSVFFSKALIMNILKIFWLAHQNRKEIGSTQILQAFWRILRVSTQS